jgi:acyl-CoA synthetase (AMP-forming)/AMP-acid ligase II
MSFNLVLILNETAHATQLPNIPQFLISYSGILKAGAVAVPRAGMPS